MKTMGVGEFKAHFSEVLEDVKQGHPIAIGFGKRKTKVAVLVPYDQYAAAAVRRLGVMEGKATYTVGDDFSMSDEDMLTS